VPAHNRKPTDLDLVRFGKRIAALRREAGLSQTKLAERAQIGRTHVSSIERGNVEPMLETLLKLAGALGQPVGRLFE